MYMCVCVCENLFTKITIFELGISIAISFSGMALKVFQKRVLHLAFNHSA